MSDAAMPAEKKHADSSSASVVQSLNDTIMDVWFSFRTGSRASDQCLYFMNNGASDDSPEGTLTPRDALPEQTPGTVRVVVISDTHGRHASIGRLPDCDMMVHCGDILMSSRLWSSPGKMDKYRAFNSWLGGPACAHIPHRVVIGGNHDAELEAIGAEAASDLLSNGTYLANAATTIEVGEGQGRKRVRVFGSPSSHGTSGNRGFQSPLVSEAAKDAIAAMHAADQSAGREKPDAEVLVTHARSPRIREAYGDVVLAAHLWGHAHDAYGVKSGMSGSVEVCASIMDRRYRPVNAPIVIDIALD